MTMIHPTIETLRRLRLTGMAKALEEQQSLSALRSPQLRRAPGHGWSISEAVERDTTSRSPNAASCQAAPSRLP